MVKLQLVRNDLAWSLNDEQRLAIDAMASLLAKPNKRPNVYQIGVWSKNNNLIVCPNNHILIRVTMANGYNHFPEGYYKLVNKEITFCQTELINNEFNKLNSHFAPIGQSVNNAHVNYKYVDTAIKMFRKLKLYPMGNKLIIETYQDSIFLESCDNKFDVKIKIMGLRK